MKRRDLLELCRQHGLAIRGSKADLAAVLAGALSLQGPPVAVTAAAESVVGVVVRKGCLKRLGGSASGGTSGASKKVSFALDETSEVKGRRRRSQVILSLVVAKTRGRRKGRKAPSSAAVSGSGRRRKHNDGGGSARGSVTREVGADAPVTRSRMKVASLHSHSGVESQNNPAKAEERGKVVGTATRRKQKRKAHENAGDIANSWAGISRRITRSLSSSAAAVSLPCDAEEKRGARKVESSVAADVILATLVGKKRRKTWCRPKAREELPAAALGERGSSQKSDVGGGSVDHGAFQELCADAPVTQHGTKVVNLCAESGVESRNNPTEGEEKQEVVEAATYRKQKRKIQENSEDICASAPSGISHRRPRKSSSSPAAVLLSPAVEKMEVADDKDEPGVKELAEVKVFATTAVPIIAESTSKRKEVDHVPAELKPAKVEFYGRTTRSHSTAAAALSPTVIGSKLRKAGDVHTNGEVSKDLEVPRNDAPITRSLRNRVVHVNNSAVDGTRAPKKLGTKRKPSSTPATHGRQPPVPPVEDKEQAAVPCKFSQHRRSSRNRPRPDELLRNRYLENNKVDGVPVGGKDLSIGIAHRLTHNTAKASVGDVESLSPGFEDSLTRSNKDDVRTKGMHQIVSNREGGDVGKQPTGRGCVRRSTRIAATSVRI